MAGRSAKRDEPPRPRGRGGLRPRPTMPASGVAAAAAGRLASRPPAPVRRGGHRRQARGLIGHLAGSLAEGMATPSAAGFTTVAFPAASRETNYGWSFG